MSTWLIPEQDLTPEQIRAIELHPKEHRLIVGGPGSGKTQVLLHRARYLCDHYHVKPGKYRIFVFTKMLKEYIKSALDLLDLPENCVINFDAWCRDYFQTHIGGKMPWNAEERQPDYDKIRRAVRDNLYMSLFSTQEYDFVLVDEGQDLDGVSFDILKAIATHITVCMDKKQQIYERGSDETEILKRLGLRKKNLAFLEVFRGCPYVARLAAEFINDPEERQLYLRQTKTAQSERQLPLLYAAADFEDERDRLLDVIRTRLLIGDKIAILLPQNRQVFGFAKGLEEAGLDVETPNNIDFNTDLPKLMPYHSAKGLTFDTVLMPRLVPRSFPRFGADHIDRLLFVGISRATRWVYLSTSEEKPLPALDKLKLLAAGGGLTIQYAADQIISEDQVAPTRSGQNSDDLLDLL